MKNATVTIEFKLTDVPEQDLETVAQVLTENRLRGLSKNRKVKAEKIWVEYVKKIKVEL